MAPTLVQFDAPGFGVGEVWLDHHGRVFYTELPRPVDRPSHMRVSDVSLTPVRPLALRLQRFFAGEAERLDDVPVALGLGFYRECGRALRRVPRGEVVTYGELAALAGRPGAARAAGTFCARCDLSPFVPTHRVVSSTGLGPYGDLGPDYKRRLLELEGVRI